jgi:hypothetical protein
MSHDADQRQVFRNSANTPLLFCLSGTGTTRCADLIVQNGGKVSPRVTKLVDYLIECSAIQGPIGYTGKVETAEKYLIPYLSMSYIQDCIQRGTIIRDFEPYRMVCVFMFVLTENRRWFVTLDQ